MTEEAEKLAAGIWLSKMTRAAGLGNKTIAHLLEYAGGIEPLFETNPKMILELVSGPPEKVHKLAAFFKDDHHRSDSGKEGGKYADRGMRLLTIQEETYPAKLKTISSAPALLYVSGKNHKEILNREYSAAIVGTRTPSAYGEAVTQKFVRELAKRQVVVVSGMARGIDSLAHQTALEQGGMTVAVLGCGLDVVYPPENASLMKRIEQDGVVLSECPPGTQPYKSYFPARNRIISGLSDCVAVMEASKKSGTMITAGYAGDQGRDLFAVPGSIFSVRSAGTNQLIQDGACVLCDIEDMLWKFPFQKIQCMMDTGLASLQADPGRSIGFQETVRPPIQKILLHTEKTMDEIASALDITVTKASEMLSFLELSGEVICRNGRFSLTDSYKYSIN